MKKIDQLRKKYIGKVVKEVKEPSDIRIYKIVNIYYDRHYREHFAKCIRIEIRGSYLHPISDFYITRNEIDIVAEGLKKYEKCDKKWLKIMMDDCNDIVKEFFK